MLHVLDARICHALSTVAHAITRTATRRHASPPRRRRSLARWWHDLHPHKKLAIHLAHEGSFALAWEYLHEPWHWDFRISTPLVIFAGMWLAILFLVKSGDDDDAAEPAPVANVA